MKYRARLPDDYIKAAEWIMGARYGLEGSQPSWAAPSEGCRPSRQVVRGGYREGRRLRVARASPEIWPAPPGLRRKYGGAEC
jgi:hypothetical protein